MTRINTLRKIEASSVAWGNFSALLFAAVLIVCSLTVGCSSEKPKPVRSNNQIPVTQAPSPAPAPAPALQAENKPAPKKVVHKKPATVNYSDKTYGVTFEYSRRYAIETGNAAADLAATGTVPMNFAQPGGVAIAAIELPMTGFANTDFSSALFDVSVNKALTADQCNQFAVPQPKVVAAAAPAETASAPAAAATPEAKPAAESAPAAATASPAETAAATKPDEAASASPAEPASAPKLLLGDLELSATETVSGEGARQSDSKYFHVFQNGACYEFALNVTTLASEDGLIKHVDREKVFNRLEQILSTVKISPVTADATAEAPATPAAAESPAQ